MPTPATPLSGVNGLAGPVPTPDRLHELVRQFDAIIFITETHGPDPYIKKWAGPVYYAVDTQHLIRLKIQSAGDRLEQLTGVKFTPTHSTDKRVNAAYVTRPGQHRDDHCWGIFGRKESGELVAAKILIGPSLPVDFLSECIIEETSQILGPVNDATVIEDTLWRPFEKKTYHDLTWSDAVILRTLYDERIKPGMHRDKALPIARQIIGELLAELNR